MTKSKDNIIDADLYSVFKSNYTEYGNYVLEERATPDIRDGLKPVQRKIIYSMLESKITSNSKTVKVARITGDTMGKYHPHGDTAITDALVNMAIWWKNPLSPVYVEGNEGSVYGDTHAAARYIEAKLTPSGDTYGELLNEQIVPFIDNYDETERMPSVLPARLPFLLINGVDGIAVGVRSSVPPHNPKEVLETFIQYVKKPKTSTEELLDTLHGPDFPTAGRIINKHELLEFYETGKGKLTLQGRIRYDENDKALHIYEIPYTLSGSMNNLVAEIANGTQETINSKTKQRTPPKLSTIINVEDNSGKDGIDIKLTLAPGVDPEAGIQEIMAKTSLQSSIGLEFVALNDHKPHVYNLKRYFREYLDFQHELFYKDAMVKQVALEHRMNIIHGLLLLHQVIDEVVASAKVAKSRAELIEVLTTGKILDIPKKYHKTVKTFRFNQEQAEHISQIPIYRISQVDKQALVKEGTSLQAEIGKLQKLQDDEKHREKKILQYHQNILKDLTTERLTEIVSEAPITMKDIVVPTVPYYVSMDKYGYVRILDKTFDGVTQTTNKERLGFFDSQGVMWNIFLDTTKPTTTKGVLSDTLTGSDQTIVGYSRNINDENREGLFVYADGGLKRMKMSVFMTKQRATKVRSAQTDTPLLYYVDIPEKAQTVTINDKTYALSTIPEGGAKSKGKKLHTFDVIESVSFDTVDEHDVIEIPQVQTILATIGVTKDGQVLYNWEGDSLGDVILQDYYDEFIKREWIVVHTDGTAKVMSGAEYAVKTKRKAIQGGAKNKEILTILPLSETLYATYEGNYGKKVETLKIPRQGKTGGGGKVFTSQKHTLVSVSDGATSQVPITTFATQPKKVGNK